MPTSFTTKPTAKKGLRLPTFASYHNLLPLGWVCARKTPWIKVPIIVATIRFSRYACLRLIPLFLTPNWWVVITSAIHVPVHDFSESYVKQWTSITTYSNDMELILHVLNLHNLRALNCTNQLRIPTRLQSTSTAKENYESFDNLPQYPFH